MNLRQQIGFSRSIKESASKEKERFQTTWDAFCEKSVVDVTDPSYTNQAERTTEIVILDDYCCDDILPVKTDKDTLGNTLLKSEDAFVLLTSWVMEYQKHKRDDLQFLFSDMLPVGTGKFTYDFNNDKFQITVGFIHEKTMSSLDFIRIGIAMFHEFRYYEQLTDKDTPKEILLSSLSVFRNPYYHNDQKYRLPHEIDAEAAGVMVLWSNLKSIFHAADHLMVEYITDRVQRPYVFSGDVPRSKEQMEKLFKAVYQKFLMDKREEFYQVFDPFFASDDEFAQSFVDDDPLVSIAYFPYYQQIWLAETGRDVDRMIASFTSYIHPELQKIYSHLDFSELDPASVFGMPIPETKEEIFSRIERQVQKRALDKEKASRISVVKTEPIDMESELEKYVLCPGPTKKLTKEEEEELELAWKVLCEKGVVDIGDPLNTDTRSAKERLQDPNIFVMDYHNCDDMYHFDFVKQIMEGEHYEK